MRVFEPDGSSEVSVFGVNLARGRVIVAAFRVTGNEGRHWTDKCVFCVQAERYRRAGLMSGTVYATTCHFPVLPRSVLCPTLR